MADELYESAFHIHYPTWLIVHESSIIRTEDGLARLAESALGLVLEDDARERSIPVFTDEHTAEVFLEAAGADHVEISGAADAEQLASFLRLVWDTAAASRVVFDPERAVGWAGATGRSIM